MKKRIKVAAFCFLSSIALVTPAFAPIPESGPRTIFEVARTISIDGALDDWEGVEAFPVDLDLRGRRQEPSGDTAVRARFAFDAQHFYAAVEATDDLVEFPAAGFQPSDGFYLGFIEPPGKASGRQSLVFGFSRRGDLEVRALVNRNGVIFPPAFTKDILLKIVVVPAKNAILYEVAIPWKSIPYFRPFFRPEWGINLIYTDVDRGKEKIVALHPDPEFESDTAALGDGEVFRFEARPALAPEFQSLLKANHSFPDEERLLRLAVNSPDGRQGWEARLVLSSASGASPTKLPLSFGPGLSLLEFPIAIKKPAPGLYDLSLGILDEKGVLRFTEDHQFYLLDRAPLDGYLSRLEEIKKKDLYRSDPVYRESVLNVEIRLQWIEGFLKDAPPFADIDALLRWNESLNMMMKILEEGKPALPSKGMVGRLGYRSPVSGSLLPYSVLVPEFADEKTALPLVVVLSSRGKDEGQAVLDLVAGYFRPDVKRRAGDFIIVAPGVSDRSGWFAGPSTEEILACIESLKTLYRVNEKAVFLFGFSRGALVALRLALSRPDVFRGVIIRSGRLVAPPETEAGNAFELLDGGRSGRFLFVHGDQDERASVEDIRRFVARLQESGAAVRLLEIKGGGHGDYDRWTEIFTWLRDALGSDRVELRPPKMPSKKEKKTDGSPGKADPRTIHGRSWPGNLSEVRTG